MIRKAKKSDVSKIIRLCGQRAKMRSVYPKLPKKDFIQEPQRVIQPRNIR